MGQQTWRYIRDDHGRWRLDTLEGTHAGDVTIYDGSFLYDYHQQADQTIAVPYAYQVEASFVLRPELAIILGTSAAWSVEKRIQVDGTDVVQVASTDGSEKVWVDPSLGVPIRYTTSGGRWELISATIGNAFDSEVFNPPEASTIHHRKGVSEEVQATPVL